MNNCLKYLVSKITHIRISKATDNMLTCSLHNVLLSVSLSVLKPATIDSLHCWYRNGYLWRTEPHFSIFDVFEFFLRNVFLRFCCVSVLLATFRQRYQQFLSLQRNFVLNFSLKSQNRVSLRKRSQTFAKLLARHERKTFKDQNDWNDSWKLMRAWISRLGRFEVEKTNCY